MFKSALFAAAIVVLIVAIPITAWMVAIGFAFLIFYKAFKGSSNVSEETKEFTRRGIETFKRKQKTSLGKHQNLSRTHITYNLKHWSLFQKKQKHHLEKHQKLTKTQIPNKSEISVLTPKTQSLG